MVSLTTPVMRSCGWPAAPFDLPGPTAGATRWNRSAARNGTVVMFICNHCPYVKAVVAKIVRDMTELRKHGVGSIAIMSNDPAAYPGRFVRQHEGRSPRSTASRSRTRSTRRRRSRAPTVPSARPTSSASTAISRLAYRGRLDASGRSSRSGGRPRAVRRDGGDMRARRQGAGDPASVGRLLDQVEAAVAG